MDESEIIREAMRLADRVGGCLLGRGLVLHKGSAGGCAFTLALFSLRQRGVRHK
jgi:hypothetical protein